MKILIQILSEPCHHISREHVSFRYKKQTAIENENILKTTAVQRRSHNICTQWRHSTCRTWFQETCIPQSKHPSSWQTSQPLFTKCTSNCFPKEELHVLVRMKWEERVLSTFTSEILSHLQRYLKQLVVNTLCFPAMFHYLYVLWRGNLSCNSMISGGHVRCWWS